MFISPVSFTSGSRNRDLKKLWERGKLPEVKYGFYGGELTKENITREHLKPASQGGTRSLDNIVLATAKNNQIRGNKPLEQFATKENVKRYLKQFMEIDLPKFNGIKYIVLITNRLVQLGLKNLS